MIKYFNIIINYIALKRIKNCLLKSEIYKPFHPLLKHMKFICFKKDVNKINKALLIPHMRVFDYDDLFAYINYELYFYSLPYYIQLDDKEYVELPHEKEIHDEMNDNATWFSRMYDARGLSISGKINKKFHIDTDYKEGNIHIGIHDTERLKRLIALSSLTTFYIQKIESLEEYINFVNESIERLLKYKNIRLILSTNDRIDIDNYILLNNEYTKEIYYIIQTRLSDFECYASFYDERASDIINCEIEEKEDTITYIISRK